jgi:hypothetical protein
VDGTTGGAERGEMKDPGALGAPGSFSAGRR